MSETITLKVSLDNPFRHPTMGKSCSFPPTVYFALPKAIIMEDKYIRLEGAYYIHAFDKDGGFIKYTDGREVRLYGEKNATMLKKLLLLSALPPYKKPEPPKKPKTDEPAKEAEKDKTPSLFYPLLRGIEAVIIGFFFGFGFLFGLHFASRFL